jgi:hypothetical protein
LIIAPYSYLELGRMENPHEAEQAVLLERIIKNVVSDSFRRICGAELIGPGSLRINVTRLYSR